MRERVLRATVRNVKRAPGILTGRLLSAALAVPAGAVTAKGTLVYARYRDPQSGARTVSTVSVSGAR
jgi:hypothetical protein